MAGIKMTFLGTGTSHGIPVISCGCSVCLSNNPKNKRLRTSVLIEDDEGNNLLIDASKDFREQALRHRINRIEHVLITHIHADHIFGVDEFRIYNEIQNSAITLYLKGEFDKGIREAFRYIYAPIAQKGGGVSDIKNVVVKEGVSFSIGSFTITPILINHGLLPILGYRVNDFAYLTDCSEIPQKSYRFLKGLKILVLGALQETPHPTHFSLQEAVREAEKIGARMTYFTHISHSLEHDSTVSKLPPAIQLAYDGLVVG